MQEWRVSMRYAARLVVLSALLTLAGAVAVGAQSHQHQPAGATPPQQLGTVHFATSCQPAVQASFDRAVALLHSFWYSAAVKEFTAVGASDPGCAMAYWGVAMSSWYPLWDPPTPAALKQGVDAVQKARAIGAKTDRERDYIEAIAAFYTDVDSRDHRTRALAYEAAMEQLHGKYSQDREAAVFYALALDATQLPTDKTYQNVLKAGVILEAVFVEQPTHPGIAHYLIHSYDYPPLAKRALDAARRYAKIAPSAPHALHMPSHIFTRLGLWSESIQSNADSARAAKPDGDAQGQLHAMDYMAYAQLQLAQDAKARKVLDDTLSFGKIERETGATSYAQASIPARYALERRRWSEAAALPVIPRSDRFTQVVGISYFARGIGAARSGDAASARREEERLQTLRDALTSAKIGYWADQVEVQRRAVAGWAARAEGKNEEALTLVRSAADLEDSTEKSPVTPAPVLPARELLGDLLMELGQPAAALREYEASLQREPNRFNGLYGAGRAAELSGDLAKAKTFYARVVTLGAEADTERPELVAARAFVAKP
jgi:tetratricopeptide (TPR) repeat protein